MQTTAETVLDFFISESFWKRFKAMRAAERTIQQQSICILYVRDMVAFLMAFWPPSLTRTSLATR